MQIEISGNYFVSFLGISETHTRTHSERTNLAHKRNFNNIIFDAFTAGRSTIEFF